ncbi:hypothetical protein [Bradyrhizobium sp. CCBAU 11361]|uniref:hypothetical protein n=1 Tax=Bradyrhizobium sp. CCBAU 11361 TaxID=1630812 RepID=UPI0023062FA8|nr:hypothetical protein [Bradyrhizobium sp. CCBAU 11361]
MRRPPWPQSPFQALHRRPTSAAGSYPSTALRPLDPDVVSASIPAFFIGRNEAGLWVAREACGRVGGVFLFKSSAVDFANRQCAPARCALVFPVETFELDIENRGNPLIVLVEGAKRLLSLVVARRRT